MTFYDIGLLVVLAVTALAMIPFRQTAKLPERMR